jgi:hypothetical protein
MQLQNQLAASAAVNTNQIEVTLTAQVGPQAQPVRMIADVSRTGAAARNTAVAYRQW